MSVITIIVVLALFGFGLWAINKYVPMQSGIRTILNVAVVAVLIIWLLKVFGVFNAAALRV